MAQDLGLNLMVSFCQCVAAHEAMGEAGSSAGQGVFNVREGAGDTVSPSDAQLWQEGLLD